MPEQIDVTPETVPIRRVNLSGCAALLRPVPLALAFVCTAMPCAEARHDRGTTATAAFAHDPAIRTGARHALIRNQRTPEWMTESHTPAWRIEMGMLAAGLAVLVRLTWVHALPGRLKSSAPISVTA